MLKITLTKKGLYGGMKNIRRHAKDAMIETAERWRDETLPKHFDAGAAQKYGYNKRSEKYQKFKNRRGIGPLQYKGRAKRIILADKRQPRGSQSKITLRIRVPNSFRRKYKGWRTTMADELTTIMPAEVRAMGPATQRSLVRRMKGDQLVEIGKYGG